MVTTSVWVFVRFLFVCSGRLFFKQHSGAPFPSFPSPPGIGSCSNTENGGSFFCFVLFCF